MRPVRLPWGRKARAQRVLTAARDQQEQETAAAFARIIGLAETTEGRW